jgi:N-acetylglucosaminyl-diphospho-decaprenol L-rhamnosyltransferase
MDLSIIIVNWNSKDYLRNCIASILANTHKVEFEIIVIDSASFDGCREMLQKAYPQVRFIQSDKNIGFAAANNEAFKVSTGRFLLFLNPDTVVEGDAIQTLLRELAALPDSGAVGATLLNGDKTIQTSCVSAFPTITNQIFDSEVLRTCFPRARLWGMAPLFGDSSKPAEVDAVSGACLMIARAVFEDVGMFSTDYFMYSEDIDLCLKMRQRGWKTRYIPRAVVVHHGGTSTAQAKVSTFSDVMMLESRLRFFQKTKSFSYSRLYRAAMFTACLVRISLMFCLWPFARWRGKCSTIEGALRKWTARLWWTLGLEKRVQS